MATRKADGQRLIINADDFGLSAGVNAGILEAHGAGTVSSTSMMVHCAGWDDAVRRALATPSLGVGLHFNLLVGAPISRAPSLTVARTGAFPGFRTFVSRVLRGSVAHDDVVAECEAQLDVLRTAGIRVTHLDSHRHTHAMPTIRRAVAAVAARQGLPLRRPVESARRFPNDVTSQVHRALIAWSWRLTDAGAAATRAPDHFIGVSMQGGARFPEQLTAVLDALPPGSTEMMVHPGRVDAALRAQDTYTWQRERELDALLSAGPRTRLGRGDIALITFGDL